MLRRGGWARLFLPDRSRNLITLDHISIDLRDEQGESVAKHHDWGRMELDPLWFPLDEEIEAAEVRVFTMGGTLNYAYRGTGRLIRATDGVREASVELTRDP